MLNGVGLEFGNLGFEASFALFAGLFAINITMLFFFFGFFFDVCSLFFDFTLGFGSMFGLLLGNFFLMLSEFFLLLSCLFGGFFSAFGARIFSRLHFLGIITAASMCYRRYSNQA